MGIKENIKLLRDYYKLSQKELAQIAGVTDKAVSTWESGAKEPRMGAIQKIADHFGLKKSNIIEDGGLSGVLYQLNITAVDPSVEHCDRFTHNCSQHYYLNPETAKIAQAIHDDENLRILFDASQKLEPEDVQYVVDLVKRLRKKESRSDDEP